MIIDDATIDQIVDELLNQTYQDGDSVIFEPMIDVNGTNITVDFVPIPVDNATDYNYTITEPVPDNVTFVVNETIAEDIAELTIDGWLGELPEEVDEPADQVDTPDAVEEPEDDNAVTEPTVAEEELE